MVSESVWWEVGGELGGATVPRSRARCGIEEREKEGRKVEGRKVEEWGM